MKSKGKLRNSRPNLIDRKGRKKKTKQVKPWLSFCLRKKWREKKDARKKMNRITRAPYAMNLCLILVVWKSYMQDWETATAFSTFNVSDLMSKPCWAKTFLLSRVLTRNASNQFTQLTWTTFWRKKLWKNIIECRYLRLLMELMTYLGVQLQAVVMLLLRTSQG